MSMTWEPDSSKPDLSKFYRREIALTHSQAMARRMLTGLAVLLVLAAVAFLKWWPR